MPAVQRKLPAPTDSDRIMSPIRQIIRDQAPAFDYLPPRAYVVTGCSGSGASLAVDCQPLNTSGGFPGLKGVPVHPGLLCETVSTIPAGTRIRVRFMNADPTRPMVTSVLGLVPTLTLDATSSVAGGPSATGGVQVGGGSAPLGRTGDLVLVDIVTGVPLACTGIANGTQIFSGLITFVVTPLVGVIQSGNPKVLA